MEQPLQQTELSPGGDLWDQVFVPAPLVLVGTVDADGGFDLAPKHQAMPLGMGDFYGFVCTDRHRTHENVLRTGEFTVSYPTPDQVVAIGQAAAPRVEDEKLTLGFIDQISAVEVDGVLAAGASLWLECRVDRVVEGFGTHDLIVGKIVRAAAPSRAVRDPERDDAELIHATPALVFLSPDRFSSVSDTLSFPFPAEFSR
ncbi:MAG: flavin reductase family protein [Acidimicrobiales bacterium]